MTINAEELKKRVLASTGPNGQQILRRVIVTGQEMLFADQKRHQQLFPEVTKNPAKGVANIIIQLYGKSGSQEQAQQQVQPTQPTGLINSQVGQPTPQDAAPPNATGKIPRGALIPAGAVLLANVAEFADKAGIKPMDEAEFASQLEEMSVVLMDRFSPGFRNHVAQKTGRAQNTQAQPQSTVQPTGIINTAGAT